MTAVRRYLMILAALAVLVALVGCSREITRVENNDPGPSSCFACHDDNDPFIVSMEYAWSNSVHASGRVVARATRSSCAACHSTEGFIQVANGEEVTGIDNPTVIHCFGCHAPHSTSDFGLRKDDVTPLQDGTSYDMGPANLCVNCHQARRNVNDYVFDGVEMSEHFGPHYGTQTDMLWASNGYEFDGYEYGDKPFHRTMIERGCVGCHYDASNTYAVGGHSFNMVAIDDEEGEEILNLGACSGCHDIDDYDYNDVQTEIAALEDQLRGLLFDAGLVDDTGHATDGLVVTADEGGAVFNYLFVHYDRSHGVHNSDYARDLLQSSIDFLESVPVGK